MGPEWFLGFRKHLQWFFTKINLTPFFAPGRYKNPHSLFRYIPFPVNPYYFHSETLISALLSVSFTQDFHSSQQPNN